MVCIDIHNVASREMLSVHVSVHVSVQMLQTIPAALALPFLTYPSIKSGTRTPDP